MAFGGLVPNLVLQLGDWYRLLSAPFLHADATHLAMNAIALFLAGRSLENLVGRGWFGAIYVIGGLGGSLLSLALTPASIVSVGASGAIMGLFAAMLVASVHYPPGPIRTGLQLNAVYVLIHLAAAACGRATGRSDRLCEPFWRRDRRCRGRIGHAGGLVAARAAAGLARGCCNDCNRGSGVAGLPRHLRPARLSLLFRRSSSHPTSFRRRTPRCRPTLPS